MRSLKTAITTACLALAATSLTPAAAHEVEPTEPDPAGTQLVLSLEPVMMSMPSTLKPVINGLICTSYTPPERPGMCENPNENMFALSQY